MSTATNKHGVRGSWSDSGRWRRQVDGRWESHRPIFVPAVCQTCRFFDPGESGDYGEHLSPPYCEKNVWFPTRKGTCKVKDRSANSAERTA
jgi:hypothetical protein